MKFQERDSYEVKDFIRDLKKIDPSPSVAYEVGSKLIYFEWTCCENQLGDDHPVTTNLEAFLKFLQHEYEEHLVNGELWRKADTPNKAFNIFLRGRPKEFLKYQFQRSAEYIRKILEEAHEAKKKEVEEYKKVESALRAKIEDDPDNPALWNQLRLTLWILGEHGESADAYKQASKLGWDSQDSRIVAI